VESIPLIGIGIGIGILLHNVTTLVGNERCFSHTRFEFTSIELRVLKLQHKPKPLPPDGREHPNLSPGGS